MKTYILPNLLPYRDLQRKEQKKQFAFFAILSVLAGILFLFVIATYYIAEIDMQSKRNSFLVDENKRLETEIVKIKDLKEKLKTVLARKNVVEELQVTRSDAVNLLNVFVQKMPDSMYLKSIKQQGDKVTLVGVTQSNAKVSAFMRALEDSQFTAGAQLVEIKATTPPPVANAANAANKGRPAATLADQEAVSEFTLTFNIKRKPKEDAETAKKNKLKKKPKKTTPGVNPLAAKPAAGATPAPSTGAVSTATAPAQAAKPAVDMKTQNK